MDTRQPARRLEAAGIALMLLLVPVAGSAQTAAQDDGPLIVEVLHNPFVVAADYKITSLDGDVGQLAGGYIGRAIDNTVFLGAAGYWLVDGSDGNEMAYGGLLAGWTTPLGSRIRFGARGLIGGGRATLGSTADLGRRGGRFDRRRRIGDSGPSTFRLLAREDFFVFEPQVDLLTRVTDSISVHWAAGYRLTALTELLDDRLNGTTGSVALQVEW
jgi:hypothetical protein